MYLHITAHGDEAAIATTIRAALAKSRTPLDTLPTGPMAALELDTAAIASVLGHSGRANVYQINVVRALKRFVKGASKFPRRWAWRR